MKTKVEFTPPEELLTQVGDGIATGTNLELMVNFRVKDNGQWCIASVEGVPFPGYDASGNPTGESEEKAPKGNQFADRYQQEMSNG